MRNNILSNRPNPNFGPDTVTIEGIFTGSSLVRPLLIGITSILISLGGLVLWSVTQEIESAIIVPGTVVVESGRKYVQHLNGGTLTSISVREGQEVSQGQILMQLDSASLDLANESLQRLLAMNQAAQVRLRAEQSTASSISFPAHSSGASYALWQDVCAEQGRLFQLRRATLTGRIDTLESDGREAQMIARAIDGQLQAQSIRIELTRSQLASAVILARSGAGSRERVIEIDSLLAELQGEMASLRSKSIEAESNYEHDALEVRQIIAISAESAGVELQQLRRDEVDLMLKIRTVEQQIEALDIRAPVTGRVVNIAVHTVGGVVGAGATVLEIVPKSDPLALEAKLRPDDIENVRVGLPVDVRLLGVEGQRLPRIVGTVTRVSADRLEDPIRATPFFRVRVEVAPTELRKMEPHEFRPGMSVTLMISQGEQSPIAYIVSPLLDFFTRALK